MAACAAGAAMSISEAAPIAWKESPEVAAIFAGAAVDGAFVLRNADSNECMGFNRVRAEKRFVPASTFKIANALIGLATGAVASVDDILPYTGPAQPFIAEWKKDMGLREAMAISNVPIFQELARRIGLERMRESVRTLNYGNKTIGDSVDSFWLNGPLKISAIEQTRFLANLAQEALPFPKPA